MSQFFDELFDEVYSPEKRKYKLDYKQRARMKLNYHVSKGYVKPYPCEYANCDITITEAHHPDYSEPLDVIWLCRPHHKQIHRYLNNGWEEL